MVLTALRGALGALSRLPVGRSERAWNAFRSTPLAFPLAGYVIGALVAAPFLFAGGSTLGSVPIAVPIPTVAALYLLAVYLVTGVTHVDGLADCGDALSVHDGADRRAVMDDPLTGAGGTLAVALVVGALGLGALGLAGAGAPVSVAVAVCAEVSAKTGMAALVCLGEPAHEGLGSQFASPADAFSLVPVAIAAAPAALLAPIGAGPALLAALLGGPLVAVCLLGWSRAALGGISGDVLGAANELGRAVSIHAGVIAWTLF